MKFDLLDHGSIELLDSMGDDLYIVNAARQSFGQKSKEIGESEKGLINFLMQNRHGTPFEMVQFLFQVKCPIFVAREWMRHRICSYNEYSGRYSKMMADYYVPGSPQMREQIGKPGSYEFTPLAPTTSQNVTQIMHESSEDSWEVYEQLLSFGVAKEVARMVLPVNMYTQFTWSINLRALMNFVSLRSADNAMWEIRQYSQHIEQMIWCVVPEAYKTFKKHGKVAP